ncbi:MAG: oligosaccharide flippase family protein [Pseudomonadota bacterium]
MSAFSVIARNIASNWAGFAVHVAVTFFLTPIVVTSLGPIEYGIWVLLMSISGYYGLLDAGTSAALTQYYSRYRALGDFRTLNEFASTGFVLLLAFAGVLMVVTCAVAASIHLFVDLSAAQLTDVRPALIILGAAMCMQFAFFPFTAAFPATQRFDLANVIGISTRILYAIVVAKVLTGGGGLLHLAVIHFAINLLDYISRMLVAFRILPELSLSFRLFRRARVKEILGYGFWNLLIRSSWQVVTYTHALVIGIFLGPAAITPFALAASLMDYFLQIFMPIGRVFFPAMAEFDAQGDDEKMITYFLNGARFISLLAFPAIVCVSAFAAPFFELWIGEESRPADYPSSAELASVLVFSAAVAGIQRVSFQVYFASRRQSHLAKMVFVEACLNLVLSITLIGPFGLWGVVLGTLVPAVIVQGVWIPRTTCHMYGIRFRTFMIQVYGRGVIAAAGTYGAVLAIQSVIRIHSWGSLIAGSLLALVAVAMVSLLFGLNDNERGKAFHALKQRLPIAST